MALQSRAPISDQALELGGMGADPQSALARAIARLRSSVDEDQVAVLLDTTGARNALAALEGGVGPLQLLDLALLTHAVVLYDVILVQPVESVSLHSAPDVFVPLEFSNETLNDDLWRILFAERNAHRNDEVRLAAAWQAFLAWGEPLRLDLGTFDRYQDSPADWDGVPASYYADFAMRHLSTDTGVLQSFLAIQTMRAFFNDRVAGLLNVPYLASALRAPAIRESLAQKVIVRSEVDRLFERIANLSKRGNEDAEGPYIRPVAAPPLLAAVLKRMEDLSDYWQVVEDLRVEFTGFRETIRKDRKSLAGRSDSFLKRYASSLEEASRRAAIQDVASEGAATGVAAVIAPTTVAPQAVKIAAKLVLSLGAPALRQGFNRLFRPDIAVITTLSHEARQMNALTDDIKRLWGYTWNREDYDTLWHLSEGQPVSFLELGEPG